MDDLENLGKMRKPLEPLPPKEGDGDRAYKARVAKYKKLLDEFYALQDLKDKADSWFGDKQDRTHARKACERRIPLYIEARERFVRENAGFLETIEMVRANIERLRKRCAREFMYELDKYKEIGDEYDAVCERIDKLKLRKPLEPLPPTDGVEDAAYKARATRYRELLDEFYDLRDLKLKASFHSRRPELKELLAKDECIRRIPLFAEARETYVRENEGFLETREMVRANIARLSAEHDKAVKECENLCGQNPFDFFDSDAAIRKDKLFSDFVDELYKFKEIGDEYDAAFENTARHTLTNGMEVSDEELAQLEKAQTQEERRALVKTFAEAREQKGE